MLNFKKGGINIFDVIVIGSGAGGATVSKNLTKKGYNVLILEKGDFQKEGEYVQHIKTKSIKLDYDFNNEEIAKYDFLKKPLELSYIEEVGGTTPSSIGNACYSCSGCYSNSITTQFKQKNLDLFEELFEASNDLNVNYFPKNLWGKSTRKIAEAGEALGYEMEPMPKFIDFTKCRNCGLCVNGCVFDAKWDGNYFIREALNNNGKLIRNFTVTEIIYENGIIKGVKGISEEGEEKTFEGRKVVLSAGAINTPIILKNSGFEDVGDRLFFDIFLTIGAYLKDANLKNELLMGIKAEFGPYFLSPHYSAQLLPMLEEKGFDINDTDIIGLMLKFADTCEGEIDKDGNIKKVLTNKDLNILKEGYEKAVKILLKLGADPDSIVATSLKGAHPGGTASLGKVVDKNFETKIKGLYISDASVIPEAPGRPPILTIVALSNKVSKIVDKELSNELIAKNNQTSRRNAST